jgi:signal transduction histidine kinase
VLVARVPSLWFGRIRRAGEVNWITAWMVALYVALFGLSALIVGLPDIPVSFPNPLVSMSLATLAGVVGLALFQLGLLRFDLFGRALDLFSGLAFGTLALANVLLRVLGPIAGKEAAHYEANLHLVLFARILAAALFLVGLTWSAQAIEPHRRRPFAVRAVLVVLASILLGAAVIQGLEGVLPAALEPVARSSIEGEIVIADFLMGQAPWVLVANAFVALLLLFGSVGFLRLGVRAQEPHSIYLSVALALLYFSQLHALLFPPVALDYVSTSDWFRLAAYLVLLFSLAARIGADIAARAKMDERLRLSRELHDGLAQQLSLANLWLSRAAEPERPPEKRSVELGRARHNLESALLEARQVITSLRTGTVTWDELNRTLTTYANELAQNHGVEARATSVGSTPPLAVELQIELLRILQEAFSNAARHGQATHINVALFGSPHELTMRIHDDGRGFDPAQGSDGGGVGLRSFRERLERLGGSCLIRSAPGQGATITISLGLSGPRG